MTNTQTIDVKKIEQEKLRKQITMLVDRYAAIEFSPKSFQPEETIALENEPLERLTAPGEQVTYEHRVAWQTCYAESDLTELDRIARQISDSGLQ